MKPQWAMVVVALLLGAAAAGHADADHLGANRYFIASAATGVGAVSCLAIQAMGVPLWWLPVCVS